MKIGDRVRYRRCRENFSVQPDRMAATGTILQLQEIQDWPCAQIGWDHSPDCGHWVRIHRLEVVEVPKSGRI